MEEKERNIVKKVCKELNLTQKELAEMMGVHLVTVQKWVSSNKMPQIAKNFIKLYQENKSNKEIIDTLKKLQKMLNT